LARAIAPRLAVPIHYGFVVGSPSDGERFRAAATPVEVELLTPTNPFERK
jgi:L-ascorbate metabolism protein UlaG (beta-lactamase superfamily)